MRDSITQRLRSLQCCNFTSMTVRSLKISFQQTNDDNKRFPTHDEPRDSYATTLLEAGAL